MHLKFLRIFELVGCRSRCIQVGDVHVGACDDCRAIQHWIHDAIGQSSDLLTSASIHLNRLLLCLYGNWLWLLSLWNWRHLR